MSVPESEADFLTWVIDYAHLKGWRVAHFRPARTAGGWRTPVQADGKGFPDLVLLHPGTGRMVVAELKSAAGRVTAAQRAWLDAFEAISVGDSHYAVCDVCLWRPGDRDAVMDCLATK